MPSMNTPKPHFLVYAPGNTDIDAGSQRRSAGAAHAAHMVEMKESGILIDMGTMVAPEPLGKSIQDAKMVGTYLVIEASTLEEAKEIVQKDPFWDANVLGPVLPSDSVLPLAKQNSECRPYFPLPLGNGSVGLPKCGR